MKRYAATYFQRHVFVIVAALIDEKKPAHGLNLHSGYTHYRTNSLPAYNSFTNLIRLAPAGVRHGSGGRNRGSMHLDANSLPDLGHYRTHGIDGVMPDPVLLPSGHGYIRRACRARRRRDDEALGRKVAAQVNQVREATRRPTAGLVAAGASGRLPDLRPEGIASVEASPEFAAEDADLGDDSLLPGKADAVGIMGLNCDALSGAVHRDGDHRTGPVDGECSQLPAVELDHEFRLP